MVNSAAATAANQPAVRMVWAQAQDSAGRPVIGAKGGMPWHLPEDLAHFKAMTLGHPVILGRATWDSLPVKFRPLPGRTNIVVTRQPDWLESTRASGEDISAAPVHQADSPQTALELATGLTTTGIVCVAGGAQIYRELMDSATELQVTEIAKVVDGDAYAPRLEPETWQQTSGKADWQVSSTGLKYRFLTYIRI